jgi:uncharacterized protein YggU (UPF0235/DUF167 family)
VVENANPPWKVSPDGLIVTVRATPKGGRDQIEGVATLADGRSVLKVRVRAAPAGGEANEALRRLLARAAGIAPTAVSLMRGGTGRLKSFRLAGDPSRLAAVLEAAIGGRESKTQ